MTPNKKHIVIAVNYNGAKTTIDCINSIFSANTTNSKEVIIVDNNSEKADIQILGKFKDSFLQKDKLKYVFLDENIGYFGALNKGLETIKNKEEYFVTVCNNDLIFSTDFFSAIEEQELKESDYVLCPDIVTINNIHQNPLSINRIPIYRRFFYKLYFISYDISVLMTKISILLGKNQTIKNKPQWNIKQYIYLGFGACYILTPYFFKNNKELLNLVFLNGEETIFSYQIRSSGGHILYCPDIKITHLDHVTFKKKSNHWNFDTTKKSYKIYKKYL